MREKDALMRFGRALGQRVRRLTLDYLGNRSADRVKG